MPPPPAPGLAQLLVKARRALRAALTARLRGQALGEREASALLEVARRPASTPGELAAELLLDPPAASRLVAALRRHGMLELRPDRQDRRRTLLLLTDAGKAAAAELSATAAAVEAEAVDGLTPEELALLRRALARASENLEAASRRTASTRTPRSPRRG